MPGETEEHEPGNVLFLAVEDGVADTIRPRLDAAGANRHRIHHLPGITITPDYDRPVQFPDDRDFAITKTALEGQVIKFDKGGSLLSSVSDTLAAVERIATEKFGKIGELYRAPSSRHCRMSGMRGTR